MREGNISQSQYLQGGEDGVSSQARVKDMNKKHEKARNSVNGLD